MNLTNPVESMSYFTMKIKVKRREEFILGWNVTWIYFHSNEIHLYSVYPWIQHFYPISLPELGPIAPPNGFVSLSVSLYSSISLPLIQSLFHNHCYMSGDVPHSKSIKTSKQSFSYPNTVQAEGASVSWACEKEQSCWLFPSGKSLKTSIFTIQAQTTTEIWIQMASCQPHWLFWPYNGCGSM